MKTIAIIAGVISLSLAGCQAKSETPSSTSSNNSLNYMKEYRLTTAPAGYVDFCRRHPGDCSGLPSTSGRVQMTKTRWSELNAINTGANRSVLPTTDMQLHGRNEYWSYPGQFGDCEDYVLLKRKKLIERGWPANALLITVLRDENNDGHAVLTVTTDMGDLVLDNKLNLIRPWSDTPYTYYLRQSRSDPRKWVNLSRGELGIRPAVTTIASR